MTNPLTNHLAITICNDAGDAIEKGYDYAHSPTSYKPIELKEVVVVNNGTQEGRPTVDFIVEDENGQRYVFMVTGRLIKSIPC